MVSSKLTRELSSLVDNMLTSRPVGSGHGLTDLLTSRVVRGLAPWNRIILRL